MTRTSNLRASWDCVVEGKNFSDDRTVVSCGIDRTGINIPATGYGNRDLDSPGIHRSLPGCICRQSRLTGVVIVENQGRTVICSHKRDPRSKCGDVRVFPTGSSDKLRNFDFCFSKIRFPPIDEEREVSNRFVSGPVLQSKLQTVVLAVVKVAYGNRLQN